eukprot:scaffold9232_cov129-Isochrysis_galbana.AAC.4
MSQTRPTSQRSTTHRGASEAQAPTYIEIFFEIEREGAFFFKKKNLLGCMRTRAQPSATLPGRVTGQLGTDVLRRVAGRE